MHNKIKKISKEIIITAQKSDHFCKKKYFERKHTEASRVLEMFFFEQGNGYMDIH